MTRFLCLLVLMGFSSCLSQVVLPPYCTNPYGSPGQSICLNGYLSTCACTHSIPPQCNWTNHGIRCGESASPAKPSESLLPPYGYCSDPTGYSGQQKCIGGSVKVCYCMQQKPYQCNWFGAGKHCIDSGAPVKSSDSDKTIGDYCEYCPPKMPFCYGTCVREGPRRYCDGACKASTSAIGTQLTQLSGCSWLCPIKLAAEALKCAAEHDPETDPIGFAKCLINAAKSSGCVACVCDFICDHYPPACSACRSSDNSFVKTEVEQSGLEVALIIVDAALKSCNFEITFDPIVCDNLESLTGKVNEKSFMLPIDPDNTRLCKIRKITSTCQSLGGPNPLECGPVVDPPSPSSPLNYVFEFVPSGKGCTLVQK